MGADSWTISAHMAYGLIVKIEDVRAAFAESSSQTGMATDEAVEANSKSSSQKRPDPLEDEIKLWMLRQAGEGFKIIDICSFFALVMRQDDEFFDAGFLDLPGPYEIEREDLGLFIKVLPGGSQNVDIDDDLVRIGRAFTPIGNRLRYRPGTCLLRCSYGTFMKNGSKMITHPDHKLSERFQSSWVRAQQQENSIPSDLTIVVGSGNEKREYSFNRAVLDFYLPQLVHLVDTQGAKVDDAMNGGSPTVALNLPSTSVDSFNYVVNYFADFGSSPTSYYKSEKKFLEMLGVLDDEQDSPEKKKARVEEEDTGDTKSIHNVTFLVGPDETPVTAQREVLAASNPVLCRILYGLDRSNPTMPDSIKWPEFDAVAVKKVLEALVHRKAPIAASFGLRRNVLAVLNYLGESESNVSMEYDELPRLVIEDEDEFSGYSSLTASFGADEKYDYFMKNP